MTVRRVTRADDTAIAAIGRIYEASIAASERKPTAWIGEAIARSDFAVLVSEARGVAMGFATIFVPPASAALLEYLAVDSDYRGSGAGSQLFNAAAHVADDRPLLVEVELPTDTTSQRRVEFYRRQGCVMVEGVDYLLPLPTNPPLMRLMIRSNQGVPERPDLRRWLGVIYRDVYAMSEDDSRIDKMFTGKHRHGAP